MWLSILENPPIHQERVWTLTFKRKNWSSVIVGVQREQSYIGLVGVMTKREFIHLVFMIFGHTSFINSPETGSIFTDNNFDAMFSLEGTSHPQILKEYLRNNISIETFVILDRILGFRENWDKKLQDPVWETVSLRMKKYSPFLNINVPRYKKVLQEIVLK